MKRHPLCWTASVTAILLLIVSSGCGSNQDLEITKYSVPKSETVYEANHVKKKEDSAAPQGSSDVKTPPIASTGKKHRMLGAIVPEGGAMLFFKLTIPDEKTANLPDEFAKLIASVKFGAGGPTWTVPEGWKQLPDDSPKNGGQFPRLATILVDPSDPSLELTVSSLRPPGDRQQFILMNVNRWLGQLGAPTVTLGNLYTDPKDTGATQKVTQLKTEGRTSVLVNIVGRKSSGGMRRPPFFR